MHKTGLLAWVCLVLVGCASNGGGPPEDGYASYSCDQIAQEKRVLSDQITRATDKQNTTMIYTLAMTAFALSNGDNYNAQPNTADADRLRAQYDELRHEAIRKHCAWAAE
jgi:hypothetical protein